MNEQTPLYGGIEGIKIIMSSSIEQGDFANTLFISMPNHSGTHLDVPRHFFDEGKTVTDYTTSFWIFYHPQLIDVPGGDGYLIVPRNTVDKLLHKTDLLLLLTGYEEYRREKGTGKRTSAYQKDWRKCLELVIAMSEL